MTDPAARLRTAWDAELDGLQGTFSLVLESGRVSVSRQPDIPHYPASTIKLAVLAAWLRARTREDAGIVVHSRFASAAGGDFELLQADDQDDATWGQVGTPVELVTLVDRMVTVSSNIATDLVVEHIGFDAVRQLIASAGLADSLRLDRLIGDAPAQEQSITNSVTAAGLAQLMVQIADGTLLGTAGRETALDMLSRQTHRRMIPAGLPTHTWSASKGGWVPGVAHDVALVRPVAAPPYVLAICTTSTLDDAGAADLVARLSTITWQQWVDWPHSRGRLVRRP